MGESAIQHVYHSKVRYTIIARSEDILPGNQEERGRGHRIHNFGGTGEESGRDTAPPVPVLPIKPLAVLNVA